MANATSSARLGSSIAYAVGRSPLVLATEARSLDELSGGRLMLGLGTGTTRMMANWHGVEPAGPASRMEELVPLLGGSGCCMPGRSGTTAGSSRGHHPDRGDDAAGTRGHPVYTAGVNQRMIEVAGRVSDGFIGHPLFAGRYFDEVVRPSIAAGAAKAGRDPAAVRVAAMVICSVADDEEQARAEAAAQIAFYAAPRTYSTCVEVAGFGAAGGQIRQRSLRDSTRWPRPFPTTMVYAMAAAGYAAQVAGKLTRLGRHVDHLIVYPASLG